MRLTTTVVAVTFASASAFIPAATFLSSSTARKHSLGGFNPADPIPTATDDDPDTGTTLATGTPGFSGFGHATGPMGGSPSLMDQSTPASPSLPVVDVVVETSAAQAPPLFFSSFGRATKPLEGSSSLLMDQDSPAPTPVLDTTNPTIPVVEVPVEAVAAAPATPIFSGFGHATAPLGGSSSIMDQASPAPTPVLDTTAPATPAVAVPAEAVAAAPATPIFSGFGHATAPLGGSPSIMDQDSPAPTPGFETTAPATPVVEVPAEVVAAAPATPIFSGFGHATAPLGGSPSIMDQDLPAPASGFETVAPATQVVGEAVAPASAAPIFSGFEHATGPLGGSSSIMDQASPVPAPVVEAPVEAVAAASAAPLFSGFGHATGPLGGSSSIMDQVPPASAVPAPVVQALVHPVSSGPAAPVFSGFAHATGPLGGSQSIMSQSPVPAPPDPLYVEFVPYQAPAAVALAASATLEEPASSPDPRELRESHYKNQPFWNFGWKIPKPKVDLVEYMSTYIKGRVNR